MIETMTDDQWELRGYRDLIYFKIVVKLFPWSSGLLFTSQPDHMFFVFLKQLQGTFLNQCQLGVYK